MQKTVDGLTLEHVLSPKATGDERLAFLLTRRLTPAQRVDVMCADEKAAIKECLHGRWDGRQSMIEYFDAANEDSEGRLPHEPGYCGRLQREVEAARQVLEITAIAGDAESKDAFRQLVMRFAELPVAA